MITCRPHFRGLPDLTDPTSGKTPADRVNAAFECFAVDRFAEGHAALDEALRLDPSFLRARWLAMQCPRAPAPATAADIEAFKANWRDGVAWFERLDLGPAGIRAQVPGCLGSTTPFFLHYLGECSDDMRRYGAMVHRLMSSLDRGLPKRPIVRKRRRIVFCTMLLNANTVSRLFVPLVERLDRNRFELHVLHMSGGDNPWARRAARCGTVHAGPRAAIDWRNLLARLDADVVVYLDLGMHPMTQLLSSIRLAPVQAALWGHPVTTGLPSMDCYLGPDAFEPANGQSHYSERLVRLPGSGHALDWPASPPAPLDGVRRDTEGGLEILCPQSVFKLMPAQDDAFARVLEALPEARLHLVPHHREHVRDWLRERMRPALAARGVDVDTRVVLHGLMPLERFLGLAGSCDFAIDSLGWSGGMTALDLLPLGLPIVALEGECMRERQTAAMLGHLGAPELVATDVDGYVARATRLARDAAWRAGLADRLRRNAPMLYDADTTTQAFSEFLATVQPA